MAPPITLSVLLAASANLIGEKNDILFPPEIKMLVFKDSYKYAVFSILAKQTSHPQGFLCVAGPKQQFREPL